MKANDLMVGDYISVKPSGIPIKVAAVHHKKVACHAVVNKLSWVRESLLEPIPITAEILERNGFEKYNLRWFIGQHKWTWWFDNTTSVSLWYRELNDDPKDGMMVKVDSPLAYICIRVDYLHQLQHALRLCGIEKEIIEKI